MTQIGHITYQRIRLGERNVLEPAPLLDLNSIKSYRQKTHSTSYDFERPEGEVMGSNIYMDHRDWLDMRQSSDKYYDLQGTFEIKGI